MPSRKNLNTDNRTKMTSIFRVEPIDLAAEAWKELVFKGPVWLRADNEGGARQKAADKSFLMGVRAKRHLSLRDSPWTNPELTRCEQDESREGEPEVGIVIADGRLLGNEEPAS
jgi:hypothetical protein